jgi:23S rRNA (guanosine2251-2'-O)-methyltransferase
MKKNHRGQRPPRKDVQDVFAPREFLVEGASAVLEYARFKPDALRDVAAKTAEKPRLEAALRDLGLELSCREVKKTETDEKGLQKAPVEAHVTLRPFEWHVLEERLERDPPKLLLALDHVTDPRNLGAIVRSAAFFGVPYVIAPERRQVLLTQASVATSQGGFALTDLICVVNLNRTLEALKERGYWIIGADMNGEPFTKLAHEYEKTVLVLGAEESGLSRNVRESCDRIASIDAARPGLESLNVSVAAGILLQAFSGAGSTATP